MKTAGNVLSALFDERFVKKAQGYSKIFESWKDITEKNGITAAADHCKIKDLNNDILYIETDHPGWKQILQTKQSKLLNDFRIRFPDQNICGISIILGKSDSFIEDEGNEQPKAETQYSAVDTEPSINISAVNIKKNNDLFEPHVDSDAHFSVSSNENPAVGIDAITDEDFKESLKKLGQTIHSLRSEPKGLISD